MKKLILYATLFVTTTSLVSCKKNWVCVCTTTTDDGTTNLPKVDHTHTTIKDTEEAAKSECESGDNIKNTSSIYAVTECSI